MPDQIDLVATDLKYPKATGEIELREAIANYYNTNYYALSPIRMLTSGGLD